MEKMASEREWGSLPSCPAPFRTPGGLLGSWEAGSPWDLGRQQLEKVTISSLPHCPEGRIWGPEGICGFLRPHHAED